MPNPVLLLEINEIPWRFLDRYLEDPGFANLRAFFAGARTHTTLVAPDDVLQPWSTWPSFHRGVPQSEHGIDNLGQDPASFRGTPIWDEFLTRGLDVGICGSLQSWPARDPGKHGFWIPDTFAQDARCVPEWAEPLQQFNLGLVQENGRVQSTTVGRRETLLRFALAIPRLGIRPRTILATARQLAAERRDPRRVARRTTFQSILFFDLFRKLFDAKRPPAFSTFFTNHVASAMHRYWNNVFPEDFADLGPGAPTPHRDTVDFAMQLVEEIVAEAIAWTRANPELRIVFATSMGQHAVTYPELEGYEPAVRDLGQLLDAAGVARSDWEPALAMVPQVALRCPDPAARKRIAEVIGAARVPSKHMLGVQEIGESLSITIHVPKLADIRAGKILLGRVDGSPPREIPFEEAGITFLQVEPGSGHHQPEGILAVFGGGVAPDPRRSSMKATEAKGLLMDLAGLAAR
jgi:hypothetical protein